MEVGKDAIIYDIPALANVNNCFITFDLPPEKCTFYVRYIVTTRMLATNMLNSHLDVDEARLKRPLYLELH